MMVMMVVFVLTAIVAGFAYSMKVEMRLARTDNFDSDLEWVGRGAVEVAKFALCQKPPGQQNIDALNQSWAGGTAGMTNDPLVDLGIDLKNIPFGPDAKASVTITDMERKWNINALANPRNPQAAPIIEQALHVMGVGDSALVSTISDSILDWVDPDDMRHFNGAENDYYMHLDPPYFCKDGYIDDLSELLLIKGVTPEMYSSTTVRAAYQMRSASPFARNDDIPVYPYHFDDLFTIMGSGRINVNTASAAVLQLIPGMDPEIAESIVRRRAGDDGIDGTDDDMPFQSAAQIPMPGMPPGMTPPPGVGGFPGGFPRPGQPGMPGQPGQPGGLPPGAPAGLLLQSLLDVRSSYFEVKVDAEINGYKRTYYAILHRPQGRPNDPEILRFYSN